MSSDIQTKEEEEEPSSLLQFFRDGFERNANGIAVTFCDDGQQSLTYVDLKMDADAVTMWLLDIADMDGLIIGCCAKPNLVTPAIIIGILQAHAAFFFLNVSTRPFSSNNCDIIMETGMRYILSVGGGDALVTDFKRLAVSCRVASSITLHSSYVVELVELSEVTAKKFYVPNWRLAYLIQSSGTTGYPTLIKVPHRCIVPNVTHFRDLYRVVSTDVVFVASPLTFDPSIVDIFVALSRGASLLFVSDYIKIRPNKLTEILTRTNKITMLQATPTLMERFGSVTLNQVLLGPRSLIRILGLGGERCPTMQTLRMWKHADNQTEIYNVYGISEMSSWATIHRVDFSHDDEDEEVPLGEPICDTDVFIFDKDGRLVKEGEEGQMFLGSSERICFIGWEDCGEIVARRPVRATGDWVRIDQRGRIFYVDRLVENQVKRNGKLVSLRQLEKISSSYDGVRDARAVWDRAKGRLIVAAVGGVVTSGDVVGQFREHISSFGLNHMLPDAVLLLDMLPVTAHGKLDKAKLIQLADEDQCHLGKPDINRKDVERIFAALWKSNLQTKADPNASDNFVSSGGDSVKAVAFIEDFRKHLGFRCPLMMDKILNETFFDTLQYTLTCFDLAIGGGGGECDVSFCGRVDPSPHFSTVENNALAGDQRLLTVVCRGSNAKFLSISKRRLREKSQMEKFKRRREVTDVNFEEIWRYDCGKCLDASPLVVCAETQTVFIGSHSHAFFAIDVQSGRLKWTFKVSDRIESSATASPCGKYVFVGCYDGCLYCLEAASGDLEWKFRSNGMVKSSPAVDPLDNKVYFGSHDNYVYAVNSQTGLLCWSSKPSNASVFSSPCVAVDPRRIYVATLDGTVCALRPESGEVLWSSNCAMPLFSSVTLVSRGICIGCVNNNLYCFGHDGVELWRYKCDGPIFSSPCFASSSLDCDTSLVLFGSHDCSIYCVNDTTGLLVWSRSLDSSVYASPCVENNVAYVCTTRGNLYALSLPEGNVLGQYHFAGDVFSSPVVVADRLLVGCRDNHLYCFRILQS